jgi:hypothetical protein
MSRYSLRLSHAAAIPPQDIEPHFKLWQHIFAVYNFNLCIDFLSNLTTGAVAD